MSAELIAEFTLTKSDGVEWCATCGREIVWHVERPVLKVDDKTSHHFCGKRCAKIHARGRR